MFDVAIIGAGLAGLTCAQQLHQAGYSVVILEKSRGIGGRVATRRLHETRADHGVPYLEARGILSQQLIEILDKRGILEIWTDKTREFEPQPEPLYQVTEKTCYIAPAGMTAFAKFLATNLEIWLNRRVNSIRLTEAKTWHLSLESPEETAQEVTAKALVIAVPAPQALMLLEPLGETILPPEFLSSLGSVEYDPCLSAIAGYPTERMQDLKQFDSSWKSIKFPRDPDLAWIGLDSSKRPDTSQPIFVLHSSAELAEKHLDSTDLHSVGHQMLASAAEHFIAWLDTPDWLQVHRWRYAFPKKYLSQDCFAAAIASPLVCCGDWCGGNKIESALTSGFAAAIQINNQLQQLSLPGESFLSWQI